jgi:sugar lactone lactonase YvrE
MKRKVLFVGALFLALGLTALLSQAAVVFPAFTPMPGVTPRGVAVDKVGNVYVSASVGTGVNEHIKVWKFTPAGEPPFSADTFLADIGQGTIGGLAVTANGDLYVAMAAGLNKGVYRVDREGQKELLPGSNQILFANGLAFDDRGTLYVTESLSMLSTGPPPVYGPGGIWRIPRGGKAKLCLRDELLGASDLSPLPAPLPAPIGANGIAYYHGNLYVTNTAKGTVLRITLGPDGSVGEPELWTTLKEVPGSPLAGLFPVVMGDGIALDVYGNLYVAVLTRSAVVRINLLDKSQETVAVFLFPPHGSFPYAPLDFPASLVFGTGEGERTNLFVTNLGNGGWAGPSLVKIDAGVPGMIDLSSANMWIGLKNSDDVGTKFDLLAEVLKNGVVVRSGELDGVNGGSSGFNNAVKRTIDLAFLESPTILPGDTLSFRLSVRISTTVSGHRSGTARLWFNDAQAKSSFDATFGGENKDYYLLNGFGLGASTGPGPKKIIDVFVDKLKGGNPFKPFGTWSITF